MIQTTMMTFGPAVFSSEANMTKRITPKYSDSIFEGIEIPDDASMRRQVAVAKREQSGWHEKNSARLNDPKYIKRLTDSLRNSDKVKKAGKIRANSEEWKEAQLKGYHEFLNRPDYVNPRGMLGKKRSEESKAKASVKLKGQVKPLEGNDKLRKYRKGKKVSTDVLAKVSEALTGRNSDRSRRVQTPLGEFAKLKLAAEAYNVSPESIKQWMKKKPDEFYFIDSINTLGAKKVCTPDGIFNNTQEAAAHYSISANAIRHRIKTWDTWYYLEEKSKFISPQIKDNK